MPSLVIYANDENGINAPSKDPGCCHLPYNDGVQ